MAGDKTYITDDQGKLHRATRVHAVTPTDIVWSSNPNDYTVQVKIDGKWHRAVLTMDAGSSTFFDNINIDKALVTGADGKQHTALIVKPESTVTLSDIKTDTHGTIAGTTTGETAVSTYSENWSDVKWQDNINVYKVLVTGSDGKVHTALLTTSAGGGVQVIVLGPSPLSLPDAIANSLSYVKAFGGTEQRNLPDGYTQLKYITFSGAQYINTGLAINNNTRVLFDVKRSTSSAQSNYPWLGGVREYVNNTNINKKTLEFSKSDSTKLYLQYATSSEITLTVPDTTQRHTYDFDKNKLYVDENLIYTATQETFMGNTTFLIGTMYSQGSVSTASMFYGNVYGFKLWQDGTNLSMDLIPAKRNSDNVVGMYDLVSEQFFTNAGTGTFTAGADVVPTPDVPMDIVSNNGKLVVRDTELPVAYKRLKDITFDGEVYYVTNTYLTGADTTSFTINATEGARNVLGCFAGSSSGGSISFYISVLNAGSYVRYKDGLYRPLLNAGRLGQDYTLSITPTGTTGFDTNVTWTEEEFTCPDKLYIGWLPNSSSPKFLGTFKGNITVSNRANFVPCERVSDGAIGYYDTYSETFFENQGEGTPTTSGYDYTHNTVVADGTVETINVHGKNLIDVADFIIPNNSSTSALWTGSMTGPLRLSVDKSQVTSVGAPGTRFLILVVNGNTTYVSYNGADSVAINGTLTSIKCYNSLAYAKVVGKISLQLERGTTTTAYEPYYDGGTATAEMLLKVGDYQDEQEILSGAITRKVGITVFDGTESWTRASNQDGSANYVFYTQINRKKIGNSMPMLCTHYAYMGSASYVTLTTGKFLSNALNDSVYFDGGSITTVTNWKNWLATQYANGTPVIVIYPLATETTETVTGQTLQVTDGDNVLEITQAGMDGLELEAEYTKVG